MAKRIVAALIVLFSVAGLGLANTVSFRLSYFAPRMNVTSPDSFWKIEFDNMTYTRNNFQDVNFSLSFDLFLTRQLSLVLGLDMYNRNKTGYYRDWVGYEIDGDQWAFPAEFYEGDYSPSHRINYSITPLQVSLKVTPLGRRVRFIPYFGAGGALYIWNLRMQGDLVDFNDEYVYDDPAGEVSVYPIYYADIREGENFGRISFGWQAFAGFMFPIADRLTIELEGKYSSATAALKNFGGFDKLDLGGINLSLGLNYWF